MGGKEAEMKIAITGAKGFLGGAVLKKALSKGYDVRIIIRSKTDRLAHPSAEVFNTDLADRDGVIAALEGCDGVIHCAAHSGIWGEYDRYYRDNVLATENIIHSAYVNGIKKIVYTSSPSVVFDMEDQNGIDESAPYPEKYHSYYPETKAIAEKQILEANCSTLATVVLRPHIIWGPGDTQMVPRIIKKAKKHHPIMIGNGDNIIDTVFIDNAAKAHITAYEALEIGSKIAGKIYFITNGEPMKYRDVMNGILKAANLPPLKKGVSKPIAYMIGCLLEWFHTITKNQNEPQMTRFLAKELSCSHWFKIDAAINELGYRPDVSMEEGFKLLGQWLKSNGLV